MKKQTTERSGPCHSEPTPENIERYEKRYRERLAELRSLPEAKQQELVRRCKESRRFFWSFCAVLMPPLPWTPEGEGEAAANTDWLYQEQKYSPHDD